MPFKKSAKINKKLFKDSAWKIENLLSRIDRFGEPIPAFNIKGKEKIQTAFGGLLTAAVVFFVLGYFFTKFNTIADKKNPIMN